MYNNKLVSAIKVNGVTLREDGEVVRLPYGTEYSIFFKNMNYARRCVLNIDIDGSPVTGGGLVLASGESATLEHPVGDQRRFKFIERTVGIEEFRGIRPEDGLVVIRFQFESADLLPTIQSYFSDNHSPLYREDSYGAVPGASSIPCTARSASYSANQIGITGHGSVSDQQFGTTYVRSLEPQVYTTVFHLLGVVSGTNEKHTLVSNPIDVKTKKVCSMCGRSFKSTLSYCPDDGNALGYNLTIQRVGKIK